MSDLQFAIIFIATSLGTSALLRWWSSSRETAGDMATLVELDVEELLTPDPVSGDAGPVARFDGWFQILLRQGGGVFTPLTGFLLATMVGLIVGGGILLTVNNLVLGLGGFGLGLALTILGFVWMRDRRLRDIQEHLAEILELIARSVRAGRTFDQALEFAAAAVLGSAAMELRICARQIQLGLSAEAALRALTRRVPIAELTLFTAAVAAHRRSGGSLATVIEGFARAIRDRSSVQRHLLSVTASARWSSLMIVVSAIVFVTWLVFGQPDYLAAFLASQTGRILFAGALVLQFVGIVWIQTVIRNLSN